MARSYSCTGRQKAERWYNRDIKKIVISMEDKEAIEILMQLIDKGSLADKEREAVLTAVGILSWSALGQSRIKSIAKAQKAKKEWRPSENKLLK